MNSEKYLLTTVTMFDTQLFLPPQRARYREGDREPVTTSHDDIHVPFPDCSHRQFIRTAKKTFSSSKGVLPSVPAVSYYMLDIQLLLLPQCIFHS